MTFLLDTCVISELVARSPNSHVIHWVDSIEEDKLFLSAITIGEIEKGIEKLPDSDRKAALAQWLEGSLLVRFRDKILPVDVDVMLAWGQLTARLEKQGRPMPAVDSLIAATCLRQDLTLVTRNESNFAHCGVKMVNPWAPEL